MASPNPFDAQKLTAALRRNIDEALKAVEVGSKEGLSDVGVELLNGVRKMLSRPGTGRVYRSGHRASAPGQPPAVDTGRYRSSWNFQLGQDPQGPYVDVGTNDERGPWLEYGTRRMAARPHLRPTLTELATKLAGYIADGIARSQRETLGRLPSEIHL